VIVEIEVLGEAGVSVEDVDVAVEKDVFVFQAAPQAFSEDVVEVPVTGPRLTIQCL